MFLKNLAFGTNKTGSGVILVGSGVILVAIHNVGNHAILAILAILVILVIQGNCILVKRIFLYVLRYRGYRVLLNRLELVEARTYDRRILQDCSGFLV